MLTRDLLKGKVATALLAALLTAGPASASGILKVGDMAPDVFGRPAFGEKVHLSDYHGRIIVISFFASWCPPCRAEVPMLARLQQAATREKVVVVSVNWKEDHEHFRQIQHALKETQLTLVGDWVGDIGSAYGVHAIPHMIIVGKDGRIAAIHIGYSQAEIPTLVDEINGLWRAQGPAHSTPDDTAQR
jgi:thiol-disulfide isomerase/thioredoxin